MDEALIWALENEPRVFGRTLWTSYAQHDSHVAFECIVLGAEEARKYRDDPKKQRAVLIRKTRNLYHDHLRRQYGVTRNADGHRAYRSKVIYDTDQVETTLDRRPQPLAGEQFSWESVDPTVVHTAIRRKFSESEVTLFELTVDGLSSDAIGQRLNVAAATVRKRWERLRPALTQCIAEETGLEPDYVARLLGARKRRMTR